MESGKKVLLLLFLAFNLSHQLGEELFAPLESLYDNADENLVWPPEGQDFSGPKAEWPGQGQQFGTLIPKHKVPILEEAPDNVTFLGEYVIKGKPVVIKGMLEQMTEKTKFGGMDLTAKALTQSGRAAISVIEAQYTSRPGSEKISVRDLVRRKGEFKEDLYGRGPIPYAFKSLLQVPPALKCRPLVRGMMHESRYAFFNYFYAMPLRQEFANQLYCMVEGEKEFLLLEQDASFKTWESLDIRDDKRGGRIAPFVDLRSVDYEKTPALKDVSDLQLAKLQDGDCLFVPANWINQQNVLGRDHSIELRWKNDLESLDQCQGRVSPAMTLGDLAFPNEGIVDEPPEKTVDRKRKEVAILAHVVERTVIRAGNRNFEDFVSIVKMDPVLTPNLPKWTDECEVIAKDMFDLLDRDTNGQLDENDLTTIGREENFDLWRGRIADRASEFSELIFDLRVDAFGPQEVSPGGQDIEELIIYQQNRELGIEEEDPRRGKKNKKDGGQTGKGNPKEENREKGSSKKEKDEL